MIIFLIESSSDFIIFLFFLLLFKLRKNVYIHSYLVISSKELFYEIFKEF
jgi:hypothetical protein